MATLSLAEIAPALAADFCPANSCVNEAVRCRNCEYRAKDLSQTPLQELTPTPEQPAPMVDPPAVETPVAPPAPLTPPPGKFRPGRG
jgi:hypothetical protein